MIRNDNVFMERAMHAYVNPQCVSLEEFKEDLYRIVTIRKSISRYIKGEELNVRMLLNQFIILFNVFGSTAFDLVRYKLDAQHYPIAYAFLVKINRLPESEVILLDPNVITKLREI